LPLGVCETDADGRLLDANDAFRSLVLAGAPVVVGSSPWVNAAPSERAAAEAAWESTRRTGGPFSLEFRLLAADGSHFWVSLHLEPVINSSSAVTGYIGTAHDYTDVVTRRSLSEQLVGLLDVSADAVLVFDRSGQLLFCNDGARALVGVDATTGTSDAQQNNDAVAETFLRAIRDQVPREVLNATDTHPEANRWEGELGFRSPDGIVRTLALTLQVVRDASGIVQHFSAIARDITETKQLQDELLRQATHDALTGLPNRVLFLRKLAEALDRSRTVKSGTAVLFVDLDNLKDVNDTIGHNVGDVLLTNISKRLVNATRPSDIVARIGGDEFVILCDGVTDEHVAHDIAGRILSSVTGPMVLQGTEVHTSVSIGIALSTQQMLNEQSPSDAAQTLLNNADTAMYRAKQRGKARAEIYSEAMRADARERISLTNSLERALAAGQMRLVYQPINSAHTGRTNAVEAYLRWDHPERGVLTPPSFIALAEESGMIGPIGDFVIARACQDLRHWITSDAVDKSFAMHLNVSPKQLTDPTFVERTLTTLRDSGIDAMQVYFEVTEATMMNDNPSILRSINALKRAGVRISIDDFGSGFSSLSSLRNFPADELKLDGSLVRDIGQQGHDDPIVRSIIQLAHSLDMTVVAEWVSTEEQMKRLKVLGCDYLQGNRIGEALTAAEFIRELVRTR
jgi:diguanylate cyclase (GGDEF)-like protein/PAS domain S-box-containing protein